MTQEDDIVVKNNTKYMEIMNAFQVFETKKMDRKQKNTGNKLC